MRTEEGPRETCSQRPSVGCWSRQKVLAVEKSRVTQDRKWGGGGLGESYWAGD